MLRFHALGALTVSENGDDVSVGGPRQRRLVAMLLIHRNAVVSVDRLADAVFAGAPTPAASTTLRSYVARIRRVVDGNGSAAAVVTQAPGYVLQLPAETFDVACFEWLIADAGTRLGRGDATGASSALREALALWRGQAYAEFAEEEWARPEAQRLEELRVVAYERLVDAELANGRAVEMIPEIESLASAHELREGFQAQLMVALYRAGRHADALRVYRDYRRLLGEELGLEPSPALADLERSVLTHDQSLMLSQEAGLPLRGYRLGERLGTGRDGTVFAARLPGVDREFAIRVIREEVADCPAFVRTFEVRALGVASVRHPAIVPIHDYWREPGAAYVVMRRMHGGTLTDRLRRGPLTNAALATLVGRIGGALVAAAEQGIVHGRVGSDSVLFEADGEASLSDFALGPTDATAADDVHDLALLVQRSRATDDGPIADVVADGLATVGRPAMGEFVPALVAALTGAGTAVDGARPNPYKGLRAFDEVDAADFFGRAAVVDELLARLRCDGLRGRLVLVVGGSGTGKSSVVRAGLLPRVRHGELPGSAQWFVTTMLPGSSPFKELAESLRRVAVAESAGLADQLATDAGAIDRVLRRLVPDGGQLLLVLDQFEELFTLSSEQDRRAFLDGVMHAVMATDSRLRVVATLRADFYDRPLAVQGFGAAVNEATVTLPAMSPTDLEAAVVEPAERVGSAIERPLVTELVNAVVDQPAALPSLQFTLYELAERSPERCLSLAAYRQLGGVDGAIASRAELMYSALDDDERTAVRQMFEQLVVVSSEGEPTRRRVTRAELSGDAVQSLDATIDRWAQARLLTLDRHPQTRVPTVELAHEALLREWPRLRAWITEDREALLALGHLREAAASWQALDRDPGTLYRGARLDVALDVAGGRSGGLPPLELEFLDTSRSERDRERQEEADRIARQARANRRLRIQLAAIAVALVVALVGGLIALDQRRHAQREGRVATARELAAAADASLADDPERSVLLALAAVDETRSSDDTVLPEAETALHRAVSASRIELNVPGVGGMVDWSPDGTTFVTEGPENTGLIDIRDAGTGDRVRSFHGHDVDVNDVAFSEDGSMLATTGDDGAVRVWDPATGELLLEFVADEPGPVIGPSFSPDGTLVAASFPGDAVRVFDAATGDVTAEIDAMWAETAFSPDGARLAVGSVWFEEPIAVVVDVASGEELFRLRGSNDQGTGDVEWSPDGRWLGTAGLDGVTRIWDASTGEQRFSMTGHTAEVVGFDWSPDSTRFATGSSDGTAKVSEITDGGVRELLSFSARDTSGGLGGVVFSPDGERLMTGDAAIIGVKIWDASATGGGEWPNAPSVEYSGLPYSAADLTPDGRQIFVGHSDGSVSISDVETGDQLRTIEPRTGRDEEVGYVDLSDDGQLLATASAAGPVNVWDAATGAHQFEVPVGGEVWALEWSGDGEWLAITVNDYEQGAVVIVDRAGTELATILEEPGQLIESSSLSPDGRLLATTRAGVERNDPENMQARIWDWERGEEVATIDTSARRVAFDPTGTRIATSRLVEGVVDVWDAQTFDRVATLAAPTGVSELIYGPDGTSLATGHADGTVRLWDPETGIQRLELPGDEHQVIHVVFGPDGSKLASVGEDGLVHVWALELDDLTAMATGRLTRTLSDDECRQYLHVDRCPQP